MKIAELPACPQWLRDARTAGADVGWGRGPGSWIVWHGGEWHGGDWRSGVWHGGVWLGGVWRGGVWLGGEWHGGRSACRSPYVPLVTETGAILVGCKEKTSEEWEAWLDGREEYQTKRGTKEFTMIEAHIRATIAYKRTLDALLGKVKP